MDSTRSRCASCGASLGAAHLPGCEATKTPETTEGVNDIVQRLTSEPERFRERFFEMLEEGKGAEIAANIDGILKAIPHRHDGEVMDKSRIGGQIAEQLAANGHADAVAEHIADFRIEEIDDGMADTLIEAGHADAVADAVLGLVNSTRPAFSVGVAEKLIDHGRSDAVAQKLQVLRGKLDHERVLRLIDDGYPGFVASHLNKIDGGPDAEIAEKIIEKGFGELVLENVDEYEGFDAGPLLAAWAKGEDESLRDLRFSDLPKSLESRAALAFIDAQGAETIARDLLSFRGLSQEVAQRLRDEGFGKDVEEHPDSFAA